jgi:hypothetical protein
MSNEQAPQFCPTCGKFISDWKTRKRVMQFAAEGVDVAHLADAVITEEARPRAIYIVSFAGAIKFSFVLILAATFFLGLLYKSNALSEVFWAYTVIILFSLLALVLGSDPQAVWNDAKPAEPQPEPADESEPDATLVEHPFPHSVSIRFYEPPLRPGKDKVPVPWESIADVCRKALAGVPFSEREMTAKAKISGPDFRLLASDFRRRGYSELQSDKTTLFTERGSVQVGKLARLPY